MGRKGGIGKHYREMGIIRGKCSPPEGISKKRGKWGIYAEMGSNMGKGEEMKKMKMEKEKEGKYLNADGRIPNAEV